MNKKKQPNVHKPEGKAGSMAEVSAFGTLMSFSLDNPDHPVVKLNTQEEKDQVEEIMKNLTPDRIAGKR